MINITAPYKTNGTHIMENLDMLFAIQLGLFAYFIVCVIRLFNHLIKESLCK